VSTHATSKELEGALRKSYSVIQQLKKQLVEGEPRGYEPIAVVGMACRFPGGADTPERYWGVLATEADTVREIPADRWPWQRFYNPDTKVAGTHYVRHGSFLDQVSDFDPDFFGISGREADALDPQHRLLLEVSWEALERAGMAPQKLRHSQTGVYVGIGQNDYAQLRLFGGRPERISPYDGTGSSFCFSSARLSYVLGLHGPSMAIDTACSSGLVALHLACQALRNGECAQALAGGVQLVLSPEVTIYLSRIGALSPDGRSKSFSATADGYGRGEGCGMLVLKRLRDAQRDGDSILAVIPGSAVNHDGASSGLTVPNGLAQAQLLREALSRAGLAPHEVDWIEAHGTGTILGDPIELSALAEVFPTEGRDGRPLYVSSVKGNIGHLEAAAGIAGVIKVILALQHQAMPAQPRFDVPNPAFDWAHSPIVVPTALTAWNTGTQTAGVSAFGLGGTNAHVLLSRPPAPGSSPAPTPESAPGEASRPYPLVLSARSPEALAALRDRYVEFLGNTDQPLAAIAHTAAVRRNHFSDRAVVVAADVRDAMAQVSALNIGPSAADAPSPRIAFIFSGQGAQYTAMGTHLYRAVPQFRDALDDCAALIEQHADWSPLPLIIGEDADPRLDQTEFTQPCLFALQYALVAMWRAWGIEPHIVVGHSIGEYAAACTAGVLALKDAVRLVVQRGRLMQQTPVNGGMAALLMSEGEARACIAGSGDALTISAVNGPRAVVIAGATAALDTCLAALERTGQPFKRLAVSHAFHTPLMRPVLEQFSAATAGVTFQKPRGVMVPTGVGAGELNTVDHADYWTRQIINPVRFADAVNTMAADAPTVVIEIGPSGSLLATARQSAGALDATWLASMKPGAATATFETLAQLYTHGCAVQWDRVFTEVHPVVPVPTYPFQRRRCWVDEGPTKAGGGEHWRSASGHPFLGRHIPSPLAERIFTTRLSASSSPLLEDHRVQHEVVVPAACFVEAALAAAAEELGSTSLSLTDIEFVRRLVLDGAGVELQTIVTTESDTCTIRISSLADEVSGRWIEHMRCTAQALPTEGPLEALDLPTTVESSFDGAQFYEDSTRRGIEYGPSFQSLVRLHAHPGHHGSADFVVPPSGGFVDYRLHPVILDTALQALASTRPELGDRTYIPAGIARLDVSGIAPLSGRVACRWETDSGRSAFCALSIADQQGVTSVRIEGIRMHEVGTGGQSTSEEHAPIWMPVWEPVAAVAVSATRPGLWLVTGDIDAMGDTVVARLAERGHTARTVPLADVAVVAAQEQTVAGVCYLAVGDAPAESSVLLGEALGLVQALGALPESRQPKLLIVTRGAHACDGPVDEAGATRAPLWGFARTIRNEYPGLRCACVDLDTLATDDECALATVSECVADDEDQVAWRNNARFALRLRAAERTPPSWPHLDSSSSRLVCRSVGNLDSLVFEPAPVGTPGPGEVLVAVRAAGLNFKDVLHALGALALTAESDFGFDAAGVVTAVGDGVSTVRVGERVMLTMTPGSMAQAVICREDFVTRLPEAVTFAEGAGVPLAFLTAWHALVTLADVQPGERVLIHAATGGVGQAAVQVARMCGAEVFATASAPKQRVLREQGVRWIYGSRTTEFAAAILADTDGRGVDVVLNSLTGDMIPAGLECAARGGRFVEIGKTGIWSAEQVAAARPDIRYLPFDLADVARANPARIRQMLVAIASRLQSGELSPVRTQVFPARAVTDAFRLVSRARHVGKVAIEMPVAQGDPGVGIHVITGGFGALAQSLCRHLRDRGVRQVALVARAEPVGERLAWLEAMRQGDGDVRYYVADVGNRAEVTRALSQMSTDFASPVVAVYHTAGELADGIIAQQTADAFARVARAKLTGAWNLHHATRHLDLQRFVLFSSVASLVGTPGQSNYAAANAGLDALATHRRAKGLPALSVNWGPWGGSGMAAGLADADIQRMTAAGIAVLDEAPAWRAMDELLERGEAQALVMPIDWSRFVARFGGRYVPSLFRGVQRTAATPASKGAHVAGSQLVRTISALPAQERRAALSQYLQTRVAITLGRPGATDIPLTRGFFSLGMDSLTSLELRNQLEQELRQSFPPTVVLEYGSIEALAGYLLSQVPEWVVAAAPPVMPTTHTDAVAALSELSEQELAEMLSRELEQQ
jgi:acyl transferase domain-containing protein/NADPH:quinone reductase-like Zn-dependent oxidoreductase/NADP-dependent 3-hydroxy acid dehydrogenase YdfG/acyl carrier protein